MFAPNTSDVDCLPSITSAASPTKIDDTQSQSLLTVMLLAGDSSQLVLGDAVRY